MNVLLSAYACEPNKGSEPAVGWNWALEVARLGHKVWVLTRANNEAAINSVKMSLPEINKIQFLYYDLPRWALLLKKSCKGIYFYYYLWQLGAYGYIKKIHRKVGFNIAHHVTFASIRQPSFMGMLGIPFIFGPVGGGERTPLQLRYSLGIRGWIFEFVRDFSNFCVKIDPFMWKTFYLANKIYVTSEQTLHLLPKRFRNKAKIKLAVGIESTEKLFIRKKKPFFRVLYVGRFINLKGMQLGIHAFAKLLISVPNSILTLVGEGPDKKKWKFLAKKHEIQGKIEWLPWTERSELLKLYCQHDVFLFPSLHDSGGQVVLEAMACGLPIVCLDLGGPNEIINSSCGYKIQVKGLKEEEIIEQICKALSKLATDEKTKNKLSFGAMKRVNDFSWKSLAKAIYKNT